MTLAERFEALPEGVQGLLIRIAREAAGMSGSEKEAARLFLAGIAAQQVLDPREVLEPASDLVSACALIVAHFDQASGDAASSLVVR